MNENEHLQQIETIEAAYRADDDTHQNAYRTADKVRAAYLTDVRRTDTHRAAYRAAFLANAHRSATDAQREAYQTADNVFCAAAATYRTAIANARAALAADMRNPNGALVPR